MLSKPLGYILVGTSISPIFIIFWISEILQTGNVTNGIYWPILFLFSMISFHIIKKISENNLETMPIEIRSVKPADKEVTTFLIAYILPFLNIYNPNIWVKIVIVSVLYLTILTSSNYHFNPILSLCGYHYYEITLELNMKGRVYLYSYVLMTKKTIKD